MSMSVRRVAPSLVLLALAGCGDGEAGTSTFTSAATPATTSGGGTTGAATTGGGEATAPTTGGTGATTGAPGSTDASTGGAPPETSAGEESSTGAPSEPFMLADPLVGGTVGTAVGGSFGDAGWTVTDRADRIYWALPRLVEGSVAFTITGVTLDSLPLNDHEVFAMYEGGHGIAHPIGYNPDFRNNAFKSMIRIYGQAEGGDRVGKQKLMWGICPFGGGAHDGDCPCADPPGFFEEPFAGDPAWDGSPQRLEVAWKDGVTRYSRNDVEVLAIDWGASGLSFGPEALYASLGDPRPLEVDTAGMPIGAVFSDVVIEGWTGPATPLCQ